MAYDAKPKAANNNADLDAKKLRYDDDDFLQIVRAERQNALGMDQGDTLQSDRELALDYYKGDMFDMPVMPNRSRAVNTIVADTIRQALPDLVEIYIGGEEVGAFRPMGEEDEEAAKQETDIVNQVIQSENDGFGLMHDYVHDALLMKAGVFHAWIERNEKYEEETLKGQTALALDLLKQQEAQGLVEILGARPSEGPVDPMVGQLYDIEVARSKKDVCVQIECAPPEDFAFARDTVALRDATYCVMRTRPRAQRLKEMGFDAAIIDDLPGWTSNQNGQLDQARDTAGENDQPQTASDATHDMRQVLIYVHVVRLDADGDGKTEIWRVITDEAESVVLDKERLEKIPFALGTPFRQPHRVIGQSLADLCIELQRIMTALLRVMLDEKYFALNSRHEIADSGSNEHTLSDYLNNTPGFPVRVKTSGTVNQLNAVAPVSTTLDALEYMATVGEQRHGVVRNAQGLNPDTLHDTAKGAQALMTNAQKRLRMIARTLAETGIRDLFLLVHSLLRTSGADRPLSARIRNKWVQYDPTSWGDRKDFRVEIGMGAGGREMDLQAGALITNMMNQIITAQGQGAISPPVVTSENVFNFADWMRERAGVKRTNFFTDPDSPQGQQLAQQAAQKAQQPDPKVIEAQSKAQLAQADQQHRQAMDRAESQRKDAVAKAELDRKSAEAALADRLANGKAAAEAALADKKAAAEADLAVRKQDADYRLALRAQDLDHEVKIRGIEKDRELGHRQADVTAEVGHAKVDAQADALPKNRPGGDLSE